MRPRFTGLWRHPDFLKLWTGQTVSLFGSQVTVLALPLTAILLLGATPTQMGLLGAAQFAPFLLLNLFAGVWVDRLRRRPILIGADFGRAALLGSIPLAAALGMLRIEQLYAVGFLVGVLTVFFDVAYQSFLPTLVGREQLVEGNSRLETSNSAAQIAGPGLAGALVQLTTAPLAIVLDAVSFLVSAVMLGRVRTPEPAPAPPSGRRNVWREIGEGLALVLHQPLLRPIAACTATLNFFTNVLMAGFVLYATRELRLAPSVVGMIFAVGSVGGLAGAMVAGRVARRCGLGRTIVGAAALGAIGGVCFPLAGGTGILVVPVLVLGQALFRLAVPVYLVNQVSLRQAITPDRLRGRVNATIRFVSAGTVPLGLLLGGLLGDTIGLRATLAVGAVGMAHAFPLVLLSPVRALRAPPAPMADPAAAPVATPVREPAPA